MKENIVIVLSGEAGQGIKTVEEVIIEILRNEGHFFFSTNEVMSRIRGGNNTTEIRIGNNAMDSYSSTIDYLIVLSRNAIHRLVKRISDKTVIIGEPKYIEEEYQKKYKVIPVTINKIAESLGGAIYTNIVTLGLSLGILKIDFHSANQVVKNRFISKGNDVVLKNLEALELGYREGEKIDSGIQLSVFEEIKNYAVLCGSEGVGLGAIAGGCNFISSYPMSPGTSVLTFLAKNATQFGIVVEQVEDEIAAINMAIGAWYAGARALVTTSGGGFALMVEAISLSGIIEVPIVIHLAQRPGPATGLPTRTEQGDLLFAVFSGHGEFPKIILAPGTPNQAIEITQRAFNMADKYGVPVIILTDQFLLDSYYCSPRIDFNNFKNNSSIIQTKTDYKTYAYTQNGISPRGIPGHGDGFVCVDSDEHDETGHITEDADVRIKMNDKRLSKVKEILKDSVEPEIIGITDYSTLIIGWGSTYGVIKDALEILQLKDTAFVFFSQLYPLPLSTDAILKKAVRLICIENNATGQFAKLIRMEIGIEINELILQYDGSPFSVEYIVSKLGGK